ncbi:MAG: hypothetical protein E6Q32_03055 [Neisseriales bacterium]|nr:MAG: hypothetical protein E6Q32_03055 [Neisseriales bacterium]
MKKILLSLAVIFILVGCEEKGVVNVDSSGCDASIDLGIDSFFATYHTFICEYKYVGYYESNSILQYKYCKYVDYSGSKCKTLYYYSDTRKICKDPTRPYYDQELGSCIGCPESYSYPTDNGMCSKDYGQKSGRFIYAN